MNIDDLEIYKISRKVSKRAWVIYSKFDWHIKKIIGDQWIRAIDSIGANIAEGFGRFHYLDKNKFNYNARGSLLEAMHWTELLIERDKIFSGEYKKLILEFKALHLKLNNFINSTRSQVRKL